MTPEPVKAAQAANPAVFDREGLFTIKLKLCNKSATVRFPTDAEISRRSASIKTVFKRYGQTGRTTDVTGVEQADDALFAAIKESGDELDEYEASSFIGKLLVADVDEPEREGQNYLIPLRVLGGIQTTHKLRIPTEKELRKHNDAAIAMIQRRHGQELKSAPEAYGSFYDKLNQGFTGYQGEVPLCHKMAAIGELLAAVQAESEDDPANFD